MEMFILSVNTLVLMMVGDVTSKSGVRYFNRLRGLFYNQEDVCISDTKLTEYDCIRGFMMERDVICPKGMRCKGGACSWLSFG